MKYWEVLGMLSRFFNHKKNKRLVWVYKRKIHKRNTIGPEKKWWKELDGAIIEFWKYDEIAFVDVETKRTILIPKHYKNKNRLKKISRKWCMVKWI